MKPILQMRLGILIIISGVITMVVGLFWWALLNSSPTHTSVASGMLLSYSVIGAILSMIGLILLIGWYSSGNTDPEENPLD